jgi:hypothetical protein
VPRANSVKSITAKGPLGCLNITPCLSSREFICFNEIKKESSAKTLLTKEEQRIVIEVINKLKYFKLPPFFMTAQRQA